jgi:UDP-N-acetylenolpyruvoylglucosamine reductase
MIFYQHKDDLLHPIRNEGILLATFEQRAEQARIKAKEAYAEWMKQPEGAFSFRKSVLRQDSRKRFDRASEPF